MSLPFYFFRLESAPAPRGGETLPIAARADVQWDRPVFRAPALPAAQPVSGELPFFVNFPSKLSRRS